MQGNCFMTSLFNIHKIRNNTKDMYNHNYIFIQGGEKCFKLEQI